MFISLGKTQVLVDLAANKRCDGTECPGGCCPYGHGWYCCPDGISCAVSPASCPSVVKGIEEQELILIYSWKHWVSMFQNPFELNSSYCMMLHKKESYPI